jgi:hypothetical protein
MDTQLVSINNALFAEHHLKFTRVWLATYGQSTNGTMANKLNLQFAERLTNPQ